jgi:uncharacterized protein DUF5666
MTRSLVAASIVVLTLFGSLPAHALGEETRTARGKVIGIGGDTVTVSVANHGMTFAVDSKTKVETIGGGTKMRAAQAAGQSGPKVADLLANGDSVEVSYWKDSDVMRASRIRTLARYTAAAADPNAEEWSKGKVQSISATSLTITGSSGAATFSQTFAIDANTRIVGKGAGTMTQAKGGRMKATDYVASGDSVNVAFHRVGGESLHASEIRVMK